MEERCEYCKYFIESKYSGGDHECCRFPPMNYNNSDDYRIPFFIVTYRNLYCGEFKRIDSND